VVLLPFVEQDNLYRTIQTGMAGQPEFVNPPTWLATYRALAAHTTNVPGYQCPSDPNFGKQQVDGGPAWAQTNSSASVNMANYFGCSGADACGSQCGICTTAPCVCYNVGSCHGSQSGSSGIFPLRNNPTRLADIADGTSNTIAVGEAKTIAPNGSLFGLFHVWTDPFSMLSTVWGINTVPPATNDYYFKGFGSMHPGGANFAMADGSVRFISNNINIFEFTKLGTKSAGEVILAAD
jgi:prepilin-type processing-associated H-X9-DG protein